MFYKLRINGSKDPRMTLLMCSIASTDIHCYVTSDKFSIARTDLPCYVTSDKFSIARTGLLCYVLISVPVCSIARTDLPGYVTSDKCSSVFHC